MDEKHGYVLCSLMLFLICIASASHAEEVDNQGHPLASPNPDLPTQSPLKLSLQDCISLALEANLDVRIQSIDPQIQAALLKVAKSRFDPSASLIPNFSRSEEPSSTPSLTGADVQINESQGVGLDISDPVITGGSYGLSFNSNRSEGNSSLQTLNPAYRSGLSLIVTQPLLEGFGFGVNRAPVAIADNNQTISRLRLKAQLIRTVSEVQNAYWELVFALENVKAQQLALKQAQDLLSVNRRFKEMGKASISDILQAQAAVASREADVIAANDAVKDAEDRLKRVTNLIEDSTWDVSILPVDIPAFEEVKADFQESITAALENRPEYTQAKLDLQNSDISIKVARNKRLPALDLEGSFSLNGLSDESGDSLSQVGRADYNAWYVGLALRVPLGERGARAELKRSMLEKEQKLLALKDLEQQIAAEVRGTVRQLETDTKRIEATRAAEELARQVLLTEEKKHGLGLSTSYELLQFQANLAAATKNRLRAVIDYRKSIVTLYEALGLTLEKLDMELGQ